MSDEGHAIPPRSGPESADLRGSPREASSAWEKDDAWLIWSAAIVGVGSLLLLLTLGPRLPWPEPLVVRVTNESRDSLLVDTRWWDVQFGVNGPIVQPLPAGGTSTFNRWPVVGVCVRVIDPFSRRLATGFLPASEAAPGDTVQVFVRAAPDGRARPNLGRSCPPDLAEDRVRIALGRYFDPREPHRIQRERLIRRY